MLVSTHLAHIDLESTDGGVAAVMHTLAAQISSVEAALSTGEATLSSVEAGLKIGSFLPQSIHHALGSISGCVAHPCEVIGLALAVVADKLLCRQLGAFQRPHFRTAEGTAFLAK